MDRQVLYSARFWKSYTSLVADKDLYADGPGGATGPNTLVTRPQIPCRQILILGAGGAITLQRPDGSNDTTPPLPAGTVLTVQAQKIVAAGTTATACVVMW